MDNFNNQDNLNKAAEIKEKNKPKKIWINIILLIIVSIGVVFLLIGLVGDFNSLKETFNNLDYKYLGIPIFLTILYSIINAFAGHSIFHFMGVRVGFMNSFLIQNTEMFFNGITPFSTGAAPVEGYYYKKAGAKVDLVTAATICNLLLYQILMTLVSVVLFIIFNKEILSDSSYMKIPVIIGFTVNLVLTLGMIFFSFSKLTRKIVLFLIFLICKIKPLKNKKVIWQNKATDFSLRVQNGLKLIIKRKRLFFVSGSLKLLAILLYYAIAVFAVFLVNTNINIENFWYIIMVSCIATTTMMWIPLPGASGGTETVFVVFMTHYFSHFFPTNEVVFATAVALVWRITTYYVGILYGGICYFILKRKLK